MPYHQRHGTALDQGFVHMAVVLPPLVGAQTVHRGRQVLIPLIHAVTGEVLDAVRHLCTGNLHAANVAVCHAQDGLCVAAIGADVGDGVAPIVVDVHDGGKGPIAA